MKTVITDIKWNVDFNSNEKLVKAFEKVKEKEYEAFMEDWDGEEKFENVFDEEKTKSEILFTHLGLPFETFKVSYTEEEKTLYEQKDRAGKGTKKEKEISAKIKDLDMPSDEEIKAMLEEGKDYKVLSFDKHKAERDSELTKMMFKEGVNRLFTDKDLKTYLDLTSNFAKYSVSNRMLVYATKPDATMVKSAKQWRDFERYLNKGAKAIWINTPVTKLFTIPETATSTVIADTVSALNDYIDKQNIRVGHGGFGYISNDDRQKYITSLTTKGKAEVFTGATSVAKVYDVSDTYGKEIPEIPKEKLNENEISVALKTAFPQIRISSLENYTENIILRIADATLHTKDITVPGVYGTNKNFDRVDFDVENASILYLIGKQYGIENSTALSSAFSALADKYDTTEEQSKVLTALSNRIEKTVDMMLTGISKTKEIVRDLGIKDFKLTYHDEYFDNLANGISLTAFTEPNADGTKNPVAVAYITFDENGEDKTVQYPVFVVGDRYLCDLDGDMKTVGLESISTQQKFTDTLLGYLEAEKNLEKEVDEYDR